MKRLANWTFGTLYTAIATVSTWHSVDLFGLTAQPWLAVCTAICFELGAAACLLAALNGLRSSMVWGLFALITIIQITANVYSAFHGAHDFLDFSRLFGLDFMEDTMQRRTLAIANGAILPIVSLGFAKCLSDSISSKPTLADPDGFVTKEEFDRFRAIAHV